MIAKDKIKTIVKTLRDEGMSSEEILQELGGFLKVSQATINAMLKAGMSAEEILQTLTSDGEVFPLENIKPAEPKGARTDIAFVKKYLREVVGVPTNIKGYKYIATAISSYKDDMAFTKELYPLIAKEYGTTSSRVERAIRHAIECVWDRSKEPPQILSISESKGKPTNSEFITALVEILEQ